jgi:glutathione S-transferase
MELISHHLCPFLHRSVLLLAKKGLRSSMDFQVKYVPIYDLPKWLFELSPKGSMPILRLDDGRMLLRSVAINAYFDETIPPSFFPTDAYERAVHRGLILTCGDLLDFTRIIYTTKDEDVLRATMDKLFTGLQDLNTDFEEIMAQKGDDSVQMVECSFAALFTLLLQFDAIKNDPRWLNFPKIKVYATHLIADSTVLATKCPDYAGEFARFLNHFGSAFRNFD